MEFQLSTPGNHHTLPSEQGIQIWKNNFQSVLEGVDNRYPANQWDRLVEAAIKILNMLRASRIKPKLSSYQQIWGNFDYNKTPLVPLGRRAIIYKDPATCSSHSQHGVIGYFVSPSKQHCQQYNIYVPKTQGN